jgi:hypothetical protein
VVFVDLWSTDHGNRRAAEVNIVELVTPQNPREHP